LLNFKVRFCDIQVGTFVSWSLSSVAVVVEEFLALDVLHMASSRLVCNSSRNFNACFCDNDTSFGWPLSSVAVVVEELSALKVVHMASSRSQRSGLLNFKVCFCDIGALFICSLSSAVLVVEDLAALDFVHIGGSRPWRGNLLHVNRCFCDTSFIWSLSSVAIVVEESASVWISVARVGACGLSVLAISQHNGTATAARLRTFRLFGLNVCFCDVAFIWSVSSVAFVVEGVSAAGIFMTTADRLRLRVDPIPYFLSFRNRIGTRCDVARSGLALVHELVCVAWRVGHDDARARSGTAFGLDTTRCALTLHRTAAHRFLLEKTK